MENVSARLGRGLDVVLCDLAQIGYDAEWHCISASCVGAPHKRDRIFIIAYASNNNNNGKQCEESLRQKITEISYPKELRLQEYYSENRKAEDETPATFCERNWSCEPTVRRVDDGISNRVERIRCLGNAVVPQCAEIFAQAIKERELE